MSNKIHVANKTHYEVRVIIAPNSDYVYADIGTSLFTTVVGALATGGASLGAVPKTIKTFADMVRLLKLIKTMGTIAGVGLNVKKLLDKISITVPSGKVVNILNKNLSNPLNYLGPSGWAAIFGGSDMSLAVVLWDARNKKIVGVTNFNSNSDYSWLARTDGVIRVEYGKLWVPKSGAKPKKWFKNESGDHQLLGSPKAWSETSAMTSIGNRLYVIQKGKLWEADPKTGAYKQLGKAAWRDTAAMTAIGNRLYVIQKGKLWEAHPKTGAYKQLGKESWHRTSAMAAIGDRLYVVQKSKLWEADPKTGAYKQLGGESWANTAAMTAIGKSLYVIQKSILWKTNPKNGEYMQLGGVSWKNTSTMTSIGNYLYVVQRNKLWRASPKNGAYKLIGDQSWSKTKAMTACNDGLYIIHQDSLWSAVV